MAYTDFEDAFTDFSNFYVPMYEQMQGFEDDLATILTASTVSKLRMFVHNTLVHLRNAFVAHTCPGGFTADHTGSAHYMSTYYASHEPEAGDIDMDAILNAMLVSEFDQLQQFIGIVDAYRVALWNAPFNAEFYAALARGFRQWP